MLTVPDSRASAVSMTPQHVILAGGFSALLLVGSSSGLLGDFYVRSAMSSSNVAPAEALPHFVAGPVVEAADAAPTSPSTAQLLTETHEESGLTWDQIARYFGVSRRAVHLWASGGRMSASNEELLAHLVQAVQAVKHLEPAARRQALLRIDAGLNIIDTERSRRSSRATDINRSPEIGVASDQA